MTEMLNKEFSRKSLLKGGGALIVGFSLAGSGLAGKASAAGVDPYASNAPYDYTQIDSWIRIHADNTASILTGRVELGHGSPTGFLMIAADELDMDLSQLKFVTADTNVTPNSGSNAASQGMVVGGVMVRASSAAAKQALLGLASAQLGVPAASLTVSKGVVSGGGRSVTYGRLIGDKLFKVQMPASYNMNTAVAANPGTNANVGLQPGEPGTKPVSQYKVVGTRVPRLDIPDKVAGRYTYVHSIRVPGMLHGRVVRPRGQGTYGAVDTIVSVDESSIKHIAGARVVRRGNFIGVVAPKEYDAIQAAAQLKVKWADPPALPSSGNLWKHMRAQDSAGQTVQRYAVNTGDVGGALASAAHVVSATYSFQYNGHMPIGPSCVVADVTPNGALVLTNTQALLGVRTNLAPILGLPPERIRIQYYEGASNFGGGPARFDAAEAAAVMSQLAGAPVRLQFMRWDEHGYDNYGPPVLMDIRGGVDAKGNIVAFDYTAFMLPDSNPTDTTQQLVGQEIRAAGPQVGTTDINGSQYTIPNWRIMAKSLPTLNSGYFKLAPLRSPKTVATGFGSEQMFDELAYAAKMDPVEFRRQNIQTANTHPQANFLWMGRMDVSKTVSNRDRWLAALNAVAEAADWKPRVAASNLSDANIVTGRGIGFGGHGNGGTIIQYAAAVADVEVNKKTGKIVVKHLYMAQDYGLVVNPDFIDNQATGIAMQATSRTFEDVQFNASRVTGLDWVSYPILRFKDHPQVTNVNINRLDVPPGPASEELMGPIPAAIANAFFDATGVRMRTAPMTPPRVRAVLKAAGVA